MEGSKSPEEGKDTSKLLPLPKWSYLEAGPYCQSQLPPSIQDM